MREVPAGVDLALVGGGEGGQQVACRGVGEVGGLGFGKKKSKSETSQRTTTLIIKFSEGKVVSDFRSRVNATTTIDAQRRVVADAFDAWIDAAASPAWKLAA